MSNYRDGYFDEAGFPGGRAITPRQWRRLRRKSRRDLAAGGPPVAKSGPGLSGHPGRRREQLTQRDGAR